MTPQELVQKNVFANVSSLVSTLAAGAYLDVRASHDHGAEQELRDLFASAAELAAPVDDWEEAAIQAGWTVVYAHGDGVIDFRNEGLLVDDELPASFRGSWRALCEAFDIDPYQREVYEHHIVDPWFADKLEAHGEKVDRDFAGLVVWARTTTGRAIYADSVIEAIAAEINV